jgi:L-lactate dehydrogenase complex protein LldG
MDRSAFLERVRRELTAGGAIDPSELPSAFPRTPASGNDEPLAKRFALELARSGGLAETVPRGELGARIADTLRAIRSDRRVLVTGDVAEFSDDVDRALEDASAEPIELSRDGWRATAAEADWGITGGILGVASTGSVLLSFGSGSPRVVSLLPPNHLVILGVDRLVPGLEEAMPTVAALAATSSATVLVTGPSRTSDIEMTTVLGMHGPRTVRVLLVERPPVS